jgi:hypothetical protein
MFSWKDAGVCFDFEKKTDLAGCFIVLSDTLVYMYICHGSLTHCPQSDLSFLW